jgi:hypothetical protein
MNAHVQLNCHDYSECCIRQTGHTLKVRYNQHIHAIRNNNEKYVYFQHILNMVAQTIPQKFLYKGPHLNTLERYQIYKSTKIELCI